MVFKATGLDRVPDKKAPEAEPGGMPAAEEKPKQETGKDAN